jgi:hypothetical protein
MIDNSAPKVVSHFFCTPFAKLKLPSPRLSRCLSEPQGLPAATTFAGQIPGNNAPGTNHRIRPGNAWTNYGVATKPDAISNRHG